MANTYLISDGVRRAKAALLAGETTIWATIDDAEEEKIPLIGLLSPKRVIDVSNADELQRWLSVCDGMGRDPDLFEAIRITIGTTGTPIVDIMVIGMPTS